MLFLERLKQQRWIRLSAIGVIGLLVIFGSLATFHRLVLSDRIVRVSPSPIVLSPSPSINCPDRLEHKDGSLPLWIKGDERKEISGEEEALIIAHCPSPSPTQPIAQVSSPKPIIKVSKQPAEKPTALLSPELPPSPLPSPSPTPLPVAGTCSSNSNPTFSNQLIDSNSVTDITTPPNIAKPSEHLKTHSYVDTAAPGVPIYAPIDMELIGGAHYVGGPYMFDFRVSCEVTLRLAHVTDPIAKLKDAFPAEPKSGSTNDEVKPPVAVKAGELIAHSGGPPHVPNSGLDFGVYNSTKPNRYAGSQTSSIYTTAVCPFDYFPESIRTAYRAKFDTDRNENMVADGESFCQ